MAEAQEDFNDMAQQQDREQLRCFLPEQKMREETSHVESHFCLYLTWCDFFNLKVKHHESVKRLLLVVTVGGSTF